MEETDRITSDSDKWKIEQLKSKKQLLWKR